YYDGRQQNRVLAPEYGGDGGKKAGACAEKQPPVAAFPAHWAPNDLKIYKGTQFPQGIAAAPSLPFMGPGIAPRGRRAATTSSSNRSLAANHRVIISYLQTASPAASRIRVRPRTDRPDLLWAVMVRSTFRMTSRGASGASHLPVILIRKDWKPR